jgi:hypothetical protein
MSIGVVPEKINYYSFSIPEIINIIRLHAALILTTILTITIFIVKIFYYKLDTKNNYFSFTNLFFYYFLCQLIGLYNNDLMLFNLQNLYLIILGLGAIELFIIKEIFNIKIDLKQILNISVLICFLSSSFFFIYLIIDNYNLNHINLKSVVNVGIEKKLFLSNYFPRNTGVSRTFGIINIFIVIYFLFTTRKRIAKFLLYVASFFYTCLIWLLQSRGSILCAYFTILIIIFFFKKINLKKKILLTFFFIFMPIIFSESANLGFKYLIIKDSKNLKDNSTIINFISSISHEDVTSGRTTIWKESLNKYNYSKMFGYGPQGDRFLLSNSKVEKQYANNASNTLIYSFLCGGYLALIIFFFIYLIMLSKIYVCIKKFLVEKEQSNIHLKLSISYIIFFTLRSFFENSFALFSIDFLLFIVSVIYIENLQKKNIFNSSPSKY